MHIPPIIVEVGLQLLPGLAESHHSLGFAEATDFVFHRAKDSSSHRPTSTARHQNLVTLFPVAVFELLQAVH